MNVKEDLIKFIKTNPIAVAIAVTVITAIIIYAFIFMPVLGNMKIKYLECKRLENEIAASRNTIKFARDISKLYGGRILITEKEAAIGIEEFTTHAKSQGINFISIKPQSINIKEGTPYKILPIELELEATDRKFVSFLGSIDELKKAIVTVNNFEIEPDINDRTNLHVKMDIDVYLSSK